jgi:hypothetical protein
MSTLLPLLVIGLIGVANVLYLKGHRLSSRIYLHLDENAAVHAASSVLLDDQEVLIEIFDICWIRERSRRTIS